MAASEEKSYQMGILYGQIYRIVRDALVKQKQDIDNFTVDNVFLHPDAGITLLMRRAFDARALSQQDEDRIGYYMSDIDLDWYKDGYDKDQFGCGVGVGIHTAHTVSAADAARKLGVTRGRITQMIDEGKLKAIKVRGSVYLTPGSISACESSNTSSQSEQG